jgi:hypothetical protein
LIDAVPSDFFDETTDGRVNIRLILLLSKSDLEMDLLPKEYTDALSLSISFEAIFLCGNEMG